MKELAESQQRPNNIDAEWVERPVEAAWRASAKARPAGDIARELADHLEDADLATARYLAWLALPVIPDGELRMVANALESMNGHDARIVVTSMLVGRAASVPPWLHTAIARTVSEAVPRASRNMEATVEVLLEAMEHPEHFEPQAGLAHGARLFNTKRYFDAHEAWENLWRPMRGGERDFFRGLINLAVAMKKAVEENPDGLLRLLDRASSLLRPYAPSHRGVDVTALIASMDRLASDARAWREQERQGIDPSNVPILPEH